MKHETNVHSLMTTSTELNARKGIISKKQENATWVVLPDNAPIYSTKNDINETIKLLCVVKSRSENVYQDIIWISVDVVNVRIHALHVRMA